MGVTQEILRAITDAAMGELIHVQTHLDVESLATSPGLWGYLHYPIVARHARTFGLPFLGMTGRFHKSWADFGGLKTLDQLERVKRNISEKLLKAVDAEIIVVSFPTVSISGKNIIDVSKRGWFEKLLDRLGWKFEKFNISNELFYVFKRS